MRSAVAFATLTFGAVPLLTAQPPKEAPKGEYVKRDTRAETVRATLASHGLPTLGGKFYYAGPFDNADGAGFDTAYPPEKGVDLKATYAGKRGQTVTWKEFTGFKTGTVLDLERLFGR